MKPRARRPIFSPCCSAPQPFRWYCGASAEMSLIEGALLSLPFEPTGIIIAILFATFLLGFFLDWIELTLIVLPLVAPVVANLGFDPIWFTILFAVCLQTSFLTPPVGFAIFYLKGSHRKGSTSRPYIEGSYPSLPCRCLACSLFLTGRPSLRGFPPKPMDKQRLRATIAPSVRASCRRKTSSTCHVEEFR